MSWTVDAFHGGGGIFRSKKAALEYAKRLREANAQAGNRGPVRVKKVSANPSRRLTKAQKKANASKRAKEKRVAVALKKFLHAQNPAVKTAGASVVRLKGGTIKITPIKAKRRTR